jgi:hypothetical protein
LACVVMMRVQGADWAVLGMVIHGAVGARQSSGLRVLAWRGMVGTTDALRHGAAPQSVRQGAHGEGGERNARVAGQSPASYG